jgi:hypothetical protein
MSDVSYTPVDADLAAAAFLFRSSDQYTGGPTESQPFDLPIPDGPYTAKHFANVPDEWLSCL